jgi:hypothetical protein
MSDTRRHTLILTCAGESERFKEYGGSKWSLTHPSGNIMAAEALRGVRDQLNEHWQVIVIVRDKELEKKGLTRADVIEELQRGGLDGLHLDVFGIEPTANRNETVLQALQWYRHLDGAVVVRDCDNHLDFRLGTENGVVVAPSGAWPTEQPEERSYASLSSTGDHIEHIVDRGWDQPAFVGAPFCAGAYCFESRAQLLEVLPHTTTMAEAIESLIAEGARFEPIWARGYEDWGSAAKWKAMKQRRRTFFVDIDGTLFKSAHRTWGINQGGNAPIVENIRALRLLKDEGAYIVLTTAREEGLRARTIAQLRESAVPYDQLVMGLPCSTGRVVVNDYEPGRREQCADVVQLERNSSCLRMLFRMITKKFL